MSLVLRTLLLCIGFFLQNRAYGQSTESFRIPSGGDSCNVLNFNFGGGEENPEQAQGPQGPPGKRGSPGMQGSKGTKGSKGEVGPRGISPEINAADIASAVMKTLSSVSCEELMEVHGISEAGYYWMRANTTIYPVYKYCDFGLRTGITTCQQIREAMRREMKTGSYLVKEDSPKDCKTVDRLDAKILNTTGGVFDIYPESEEESVTVYCDLETDGGGWTVFQRRLDGSVDFYRDWDEYMNGFGEKDKEFWLGLELIHQLTKDGNYELRVDLTDWSGNTAYAKYGTFTIASREDNYRLNVGPYSGTAGDSLTTEHNNQPFSTKNIDNDGSSGNCAQIYKGAWWHKSCHHSNLNGLYHNGPGTNANGVVWYHWKTAFNYLKFSEMKFRKKE